ncbi:MAG TPA: nucleotide sugar dehydrogenase [Candidatus Nanoarchaeia archaeon]|nr:nucleotide sugar dehydrogenase [Candidatus Nanoarchaeia archaeon]
MAEFVPKICVLGLGYVGLPLAVTLARKHKITGFDIKASRVEELKKGKDSTNEVSPEELIKAGISFSSDPSVMKSCNFIIAAVPTPVDDDKKPDLSFVESASVLIGKNLSKGSIVVFESTVYPGVTEDCCVPLIEKNSGLKCGSDWKIGYSPERVNPGDKEHTIDRVIKIVSGMDGESASIIAKVYGSVISAGIHVAPDIKTAEAAKVIENIQRDLNIALMNELSLIFSRMGVKTKDVLAAAGTKWNFHKYTPGLVGGHCIGVDPYYLTFRAHQLGYESKVILAGREVNDSMAGRVVELAEQGLYEVGKNIKGSKVLVLGLTFKENVPDVRNSKVKDVIEGLKAKGAAVLCSDPLFSYGMIVPSIGVQNLEISGIIKVDAVILAVAHSAFKSITLKELAKKMDIPVIVDVKGFFNHSANDGFVYKTL